MVELMPRERDEPPTISTKRYGQLGIYHNYKTIARSSMTSDYVVEKQVTG